LHSTSETGFVKLLKATEETGFVNQTESYALVDVGFFTVNIDRIMTKVKRIYPTRSVLKFLWL